MHGPMNHPSLNGTHPAMLATQRFNADVQLPYRFPICARPHAHLHCDDDCMNSGDYKQMLEDVQYTQDSQAGYACDYQNKQAPRCCNEVKEVVKGHRELHVNLAQESATAIGKRHVTRLCCDAYGKGVARSNQESYNLRVYAKDNDVLVAETFRTAQTVAFPGQDLIR